MQSDYLRRLKEDGMDDRDLERLKAAPDFGRAALRDVDEARKWLEEGIGLFENPPEAHLPNGADVDEMKGTVIAYLDAASDTLRRESDKEDSTAYADVDLAVPRPGFLVDGTNPFGFRVEICKFFESARREYPYWRVAFPYWEARINADEDGGSCVGCGASLEALRRVNLAESRVLEGRTDEYVLNAGVVRLALG